MKTCKKCGASEFYDGSSGCKPCARKRAAEYRLKNPEKARAAIKDWEKRNPEKTKNSRKKWVASNREKVRAIVDRYREKNPDLLRERFAEWYEKNKENVQQYRLANRDRYALHARNRRALKSKNGGVLSENIEKRLMLLQNGKCACCGLPLGDDYHLDHIMPLSLGGTNTDDNIQLLRAKCNLQKSAKHPVDFMRQRGFLL